MSLLLHPLPRPHDKVNRRPREPQPLPELIVEVTLVGKVERLIDVREQREGRWAGFELGHVIETAGLAADGRWVVCTHGPFEDRVELRRAEPAAIALDDRIDSGKDLLHAAP